jgi:RNA polymerase sigma-70 factor (ECF subfamily)
MPADPRKKTPNPDLVGSWARQWHRQLHRFLARRLPSEADTQDLVQEVYLRLLRFDGAELVRHPRAYLCKIAAHVACEWQLESRQSKPHSSDALDELVSDDALGEGIDLDRRRERMRGALAELPANMRAALMLQYRDGLSYEEIASEMKVSLRMVRRYIEEGYVRLRQQLGVRSQGMDP